MTQECKVKGKILADGTLKLESPFPLLDGEVEVVIRLMSERKSDQSIWDVIDRGSVERTKEEIDADIYALREEWEHR